MMLVLDQHCCQSKSEWFFWMTISKQSIIAEALSINDSLKQDGILFRQTEGSGHPINVFNFWCKIPIITSKYFETVVGKILNWYAIYLNCRSNLNLISVRSNSLKVPMAVTYVEGMSFSMSTKIIEFTICQILCNTSTYCHLIVFASVHIVHFLVSLPSSNSLWRKTLLIKFYCEFLHG